MVTARHITFVCLLLFGGSAWAWQPAPSAVDNHPGVTTLSMLRLEPAAPLQWPSDAPSQAAQPDPDDEALSLNLPDVTTRIAEWIGKAADIIKSKLSLNTFDLTPEPVSTPEVTPITPFNPAYGLQGFMAQQWVTPRFGLSAGLGLNLNEEPDQEDSDDFNITELRDDLLFGMGLTVAF